MRNIWYVLRQKMTFISSSQPRHWLVSYKCWGVFSSRMRKLCLFFLLFLHNRLPEVCSQLVTFLFKELLRYIHLVRYALLPNIFVTLSPDKSPSSPKQAKEWLLLKPKQCVKFPTSILNPFSVFTCTWGYWQHFCQFFYLTAAHAAAEIWFNLRITTWTGMTTKSQQAL